MAVFRSVKTGKGTAADTNAAQFPDVICSLVIFKAPAANTGTVTILGVTGTTINTDGIVLAAGDPPLTIEIDNLKRLAFKLSVANESVGYLTMK
jgi:hypothetical protein